MGRRVNGFYWFMRDLIDLKTSSGPLFASCAIITPDDFMMASMRLSPHLPLVLTSSLTPGKCFFIAVCLPSSSNGSRR